MYFVRVEMERKTLDCVCCNPGFDFVDYYDYLHDSLTRWLRPNLSLFIDPHWMAASMPWIWIIVYFVMDGCAHTTYISCIWDISFTSSCGFSDSGVFSWTRSRKAFHPSLSFGPHTLGGICYTVICHCPCHSPSRTLEGSFRDLWAETRLENTFMTSLWTWAFIVLKTSLCKKP